MKKPILIGLLAALFAPAASAQNSFNGTWKIDLKTADISKKPDVFLLKDGMFKCSSCVPPLEVKADGQDQKVTGHPYYDAVSVKIVDDHTVFETEKKGGRVVGTEKTTVAANGKTATFEFTDTTDENSAPITGKGTEIRVASQPPGSHAISGSWRTTRYANISDNGLAFTMKVEGDTVVMTNPTGQSYTATLGGPDAPYKGDPGVTSVAVKRIGKNTIEETDKRNGKAVSIVRMTVSADGKTMLMAMNDVEHGRTSRFTAIKQ
ncbi:MAG TPA: hypothetical protein VJO53_12670 [Candidatus Acidoferrales bacterium]|nr:hypothetical protein [Candidatus Acidoferrales bacterium]